MLRRATILVLGSWSLLAAAILTLNLGNPIAADNFLTFTSDTLLWLGAGLGLLAASWVRGVGR